MNKQIPDITYSCIESEHTELIVTTAMEHCYPWHFHAQHTIIGFVCAGTVVVKKQQKQQKQQTLASGSFFIIQPYEMHSLEVFSHSKLAVFSFDLREQRYLEALKKNCADLYAAYKSKDNEFTLTKEQITEIQQFQENIADTLIMKDKKIEQVCNLLLHNAESSLAAALSIPQMAAIAGYSTWHFLRCFQVSIGMAPHMFQTICKLRVARTLLRKNMATVDVAMFTGFTDQSHLHKVFKLHYGLTPRQFLQATVKV